MNLLNKSGILLVMALGFVGSPVAYSCDADECVEVTAPQPEPEFGTPPIGGGGGSSGNSDGGGSIGPSDDGGNSSPTTPEPSIDPVEECMLKADIAVAECKTKYGYLTLGSAAGCGIFSGIPYFGTQLSLACSANFGALGVQAAEWCTVQGNIQKAKCT